MPAPLPIDRNQPSFLRFPIQNDRTGFQPVSLPVILVVPRRRNENGTVLGGTEVFDVKYYIAEAPDPSKVAGPFNTGLLVPQLNQFVINVSSLDLLQVFIRVPSQIFRDAQGNQKTYADAVEGDYFEYTTIRNNIRSTILYYPDADYYDMTLFIMDVEDLPRPHRYWFVWQASYNRREVRSSSIASVRGAVCVNESKIGVAQYRILINHPGEVHQHMFKNSPAYLFDSSDNYRLADDKTLAFYRPFADMLQDIFDEQFFLNGINHIDRIPAQLIPYLAYLIGWDLPNFPGVTDTVRRSILRHAVRLQQLKGSRRAIVELFDIFGFSIDIINLWYTIDGTRLIAPSEMLPEVIQGQEIKQETVCQIDPLVVDYDTSGFGEFEIPLIYKAIDDITISAFLVTDGPTRDVLNQIVIDLTDDPAVLEANCQRTLGGNIIPQALLSRLPSGDATLLATSEVFVDYNAGKGDSAVNSSLVPVLNELGVTYDKDRNLISVNFDHYIDFSGDLEDAQVFLFATYPRTKITVPDSLDNLRSNRFDVRILLRGGDPPDPELFEFLMNFVFKLKAFHSLLRKIIFTLNLIEAYNVQDWCADGQANLQVPPAIEPIAQTIEECDEESISLGYKPEDLEMRDAIYNSLLENFIAWKELDGRARDASLDKFLNLPVAQPDGINCQYTQLGQDRVETVPDSDLDHNEDIRAKVCATAGLLPDNCFKGRVKDDLFVVPQLLLCEIIRCKPCSLGMGSGFYWLYNQTLLTLMRDGFGSYRGQVSTSFLGIKIKQYGKPFPYSLHYTNRPLLINGQLESNQLLAYRRPSLEVEKDNLAFPSHRFPSMANLLDDFTHPDWSAKPWDDIDNNLNAVLEVNSDGDEVLYYDEAELVYEGNGLVPDISSLGTHDDRSFLVTHKVFMTAEAGHPSLQFDDRIVRTEEVGITLDSSKPFGPIFRSYNPDCNQDYISGYPAETDRFDVEIADSDFDRGDTVSANLAEILGLPLRDMTGSGPVTALFTCGSEILVTEDDNHYHLYKPYRLDCECARFVCGTGLTDVLTGTISDVTCQNVDVNLSGCNLDLFKQPDGTYDFNCDQLTIAPRVQLTESLGVCSQRLDGTIPNMLCILDTSENIPARMRILPEGSIRYKDDYGVIYESSWFFMDGILDIIMTTKQPRVWGEPETGYVTADHRVFRRGIITTIRQIIRVNSDGTYVIRGEGAQQKIDMFQSNVICGDAPFMDNFCFHLECMVTDEIQALVLCGSRWVFCDEMEVQWPELITDSAGVVTSLVTPDGIQPFQWISVWGNAEGPDLTGVCPPTDYGSEEPVEVGYVGAGGIIPVYEENQGIWPTKRPRFKFVSELEIVDDFRIIELTSIDFGDFFHTFSGDLHAILLSPLGCPSMTIFHRPGSVLDSFGNYADFDGNYRFVESGAPLLTDVGPIYPGTYRRDPGDWPGNDIAALGSFKDFHDISTRGVWKLIIYDWSFGDVGSLSSWTLNFRVLCNDPLKVDKV